MSLCYIFDLDGTLSNDRHRWHFIRRGGNENPDWDAYYSACTADSPIKHMIDLLNIIQKAGFKIVIVTGRSETIRRETKEWLLQNNIWYDELIMRRVGDRRKNSELKVAAVELLRKQGYWPIMAFEDLPSAVKTYREAGIPCLQVDDPEDWADIKHP